MKVAILGIVHPRGLGFLKENGFQIFEIKNFEIENLKEQLKDVDGILLRTSTLDKDILQHCDIVALRDETGLTLGLMEKQN